MVLLKIDENLPVEVSVILQDAGHDALSIHDQNMVGSTDEHIAKICKTEKRAIVTLDLDFADIRSYTPEEYYGIIVLRPRHQDKESVLDVFKNLLPKLNDEPLAGKLWIVTRQSIRIRG